jgi:hypothetical protein
VAVEPVLDDFPDSFTTDDFWALIGKLEHERVEFKGGAVSAELAEAYSAMGSRTHRDDARWALAQTRWQ